MGIWPNPSRMRSARMTNGHTRQGSRFRGVQVNRNRTGCCNAVRKIAGQRFLSHEVPVLPLDGCDAADCQCTYQLFEDRRTQIRRASGATGGDTTPLRIWDDRNSSSPGRRHED